MLGWCFFSSRRRHTRYWRDWSSDVCSSDLFLLPRPAPAPADSSTGLPEQFQSVQVERLQEQLPDTAVEPVLVVVSRTDGVPQIGRARVGKECRSRWAPYH